MTTIDMHLHLPVPEWLDGAIGPYLASAERYFHTTVTARPIEDLAAEYEALDTVGVLLAWDAETFTGRPPLSNELVAGVVKRFPGRFVGFGSVDPLKPNAPALLRQLPDLGLKGLKLSEDEMAGREDDLQKKVDEFNAKIEEAAKHKEADVLKV